MPLRLPKLFVYLLGAVLVINLLQAHFTELIFDEAYYWYYSQNIAWGYFDHPPMVAWLIRFSSLFFNGELGVRLMSCLLSAGTLLVLWQLIDTSKKKDYILHYFVLAFSMTLLNAYGFLMLPDTPLLFFTALFLLIYKKFIAEPSPIYSLLLGLAMAALMYSKYNGVLIIVFVLLSNLKLLKNKYAWLAVFVSLIAYTPHFVWLFNNDFISIQYHLFERPNQAYSFEKFTVGYFLNLIAIFGFTFPLVYYILYKTKPLDKFTRAMVFLSYGVLLFFFVSSFSKRVQTQWVIVVSIPLLVLVFQYIIEHETIRKWVFRLALVNVVILLFLRIGLIYKPLFPIYYETHGNKEWVSRIAEEAGDNPVVFENSYTYPSLYSFYSGKLAFSLNNINYRQNQFSIDDYESKIQHQKVLYLSRYTAPNELAFPRLNGQEHYGRYIENFESFRNLKCLQDEESIAYDTEKEYTFKVYNPYDIAIPLAKIEFGVAYLNAYKEVRDVRPMKAKPVNETILTLKSNDTLSFTFKLPKSKMESPTYFRIGISENKLHYGLNGKNTKLH